MSSMKWRMTAVLAAVMSATLFYFGTGLRPVPWCTWLAPLPVLVLAPRVSARVAFIAAFAAWLAGETVMWGYFLSTLRIPAPVAAAVIIGSALMFGLVVMAARALMLRGHLLLAAGIVPAAWVALEYAMSVAAPFGAWWSLAYTQADVLPVLQVTSAAGPWGVTFLVMGAPAAAAALLAPGAAGRLRVAVAAVAILAVALTYGAWQLHLPHGVQPEKVALIATDRQIDPEPVTTSAGRALLGQYAARIAALAEGGARVVVLPEKTFVADGTSLSLVAAPLSQLAAEHHVDIIVGLVLIQGGAEHNTAIDFPADGGRPVYYFKRHLILGIEHAFTPGDADAYVPGFGRRWAIAICFDMDFPGLVRGYRRSGATVMFVPAWDFGRDAWLHSRMAITRGVENGLTVVRAARQGALTVSDPHGRVVAEARTNGASFVSVTTDLPRGAVSTLYTRFGDWLAWACILLLLAGSAGLLLAGISARRRGGTHREPGVLQASEAGPQAGESAPERIPGWRGAGDPDRRLPGPATPTAHGPGRRRG
jgi:apolipoprotein N-acyltransferase